MTRPAYPIGWPVGSKDRGLARSPGDYAWNVNFNNGNANWNDHDNEGFVRAVRAGECRGVALSELHAAWLEARRGKRPSASQAAFEVFWVDGLLRLQEQIDSGQWQPSPPTCFIAHRPKAREIHAPDFEDRVVHHWIVPQLDALYEPAFIFDSFSNRKGKGTHAAVDRLQSFMRQVSSGQGGGWYLQLDVFNFFNSIHRPTLYRLLKERMTRHGLPLEARRVVHALLRRSPIHAGARYACTAAERVRVPAHKQLANAAPGCGIAIGNLSSQFFANVYLNELDQFVKHQLKARRYIRYVDDFVLVHRDRERLVAWRAEIEGWLRQALRLELKSGGEPRQISDGVDFLGYVIRPSHRVVRRRVIRHAREKLLAWERAHIRRGRMAATPAEYRRAVSIWSSYCGHFAHAASSRLHMRLRDEFPWLRTLRIRRRFDHRLEGHRVLLKGGRHAGSG